MSTQTEKTTQAGARTQHEWQADDFAIVPTGVLRKSDRRIITVAEIATAPETKAQRDELLTHCKVLREAVAASFRVLSETDPINIEKLELALASAGVPNGFGKAAQDAIVRAAIAKAEQGAQ